jgi:hypothetical protein
VAAPNKEKKVSALDSLVNNIEGKPVEDVAAEGLTQITNNEAMAKTVRRNVHKIGEAAGVNAAVSDKVANNISNPIKVEEAAIEPDKGIDSAFVAAIGAFAPMLLGGLFGGTEGAAAAGEGTMAGAKMGIELADALGPEEQQQVAGGFQQSRNTVTKTGESVVFQPGTGKFFKAGDLTQEVAATELKSVQGERLDLSSDRLTESQMKRKLSENRLSWQKAERDELSDTQSKSIADLRTGIDLLDNILLEKRAKNIDTGPLSAARNSVAQYFGIDDAKVSAFKANVQDNLAQYIKYISGVAVSVEEARRLSTAIPKLSDQDATFISKLEAMKKRLLDREGIIVKTAREQGRDPEKFEQSLKMHGGAGKTLNPAQRKAIIDRLKAKRGLK